MNNTSEIKRKSFIIHFDSWEVVSELLNTEQKGELIEAMYLFNATGAIPDFQDGQLKMAFRMFEKQFIRDMEKYEKKVQANRANGQRGGKPPEINPNLDLSFLPGPLVYSFKKYLKAIEGTENEVFDQYQLIDLFQEVNEESGNDQERAKTYLAKITKEHAPNI
ncbi:DUF6291 domain-containing protein [Marinilabilia rubra]|uniref:DUF6291 domain-containing protein n=1 Tax=Marinilabilia rubra TaxID=2162893 RepID=A0A2U2BD42_9BACT|nr:DUF6291 domain-containing protein [Marinilabilia rubra]PWE00995.1 hypothetical protein DDZ16_00465 [Marinilabilia rubra]